jgi:hypothetical protein
VVLVVAHPQKAPVVVAVVLVYLVKVLVAQVLLGV